MDITCGSALPEWMTAFEKRKSWAERPGMGHPPHVEPLGNLARLGCLNYVPNWESLPASEQAFS